MGCCDSKTYPEKEKAGPRKYPRRFKLMADEKFKHFVGEKATFGMSWFWFPEGLFGAAPGVIRTRVGFSGGGSRDPTYQQLGDHTETVDIDFDPNITSFDEMLKLFWGNHNPANKCSRQYMSAIFYNSPMQKATAEASMKAEILRRGDSHKIQTKIIRATDFYVAEDYHQKYLLQRHSNILDDLDIQPGEELTNSHIATRLNGYLGGYGSMDSFDKECEELELPKSVENYVRSHLGKYKKG